MATASRGSSSSAAGRPATLPLTSDLDVAVILAGESIERYPEMMALADIAYDAIVETGIEVQAWPVSSDEWQNPEKHRNPALVRAMRRDGRSVEEADISDPISQGA